MSNFPPGGVLLFSFYSDVVTVLYPCYQFQKEELLLLWKYGLWMSSAYMESNKVTNQQGRNWNNSRTVLHAVTWEFHRYVWKDHSHIVWLNPTYNHRPRNRLLPTVVWCYLTALNVKYNSTFNSEWGVSILSMARSKTGNKRCFERGVPVHGQTCAQNYLLHKRLGNNSKNTCKMSLHFPSWKSL